MLDYLASDDSESPAIGIVPPGTTWEQGADHIKIAHSPLLITPGAGGEFAGAYWTGTAMVVASDLGPDLDEAVAEFRSCLRERGEA